MQVKAHAKIVLALLGSAIGALIVAFIFAAFSVSGVLNMSTADLFLWIAFGIFLVTLLATAILYLPEMPTGRMIVVAIFIILAGIGVFFGRSRLYAWLLAKKAEQEKTQAVAPISPTVPPTKTNGHLGRDRVPPQAKLIFKASPLLTSARRMRIQGEVDDYYRYLSSIGFDTPKEIPPVGVRPGKVTFRSSGYPGTIYSEELMLPGDYLDDKRRVIAAFSIWIFDKLFMPNPSDLNGFLFTSAIIFSNYYYADFNNVPPSAPRRDALGDKWISAIWDIRQKHGREFANKSLFYTFKQWHVPVENQADENFDMYFGRRFMIGVDVEDNMRQHLESVTQILKARRIQLGGN